MLGRFQNKFLGRQTPPSNYLKSIDFETYYIKSNPLLFCLPTKHATIPQHGPFSVHTIAYGPWRHETAFPTPTVRPLDESHGPSPLQGHGSWLMCEVALSVRKLITSDQHWTATCLKATSLSRLGLSFGGGVCELGGPKAGWPAAWIAAQNSISVPSLVSGLWQPSCQPNLFWRGHVPSHGGCQAPFYVIFEHSPVKNEKKKKEKRRPKPSAWLRAWLVSRDFCNFERTWVSFGIVFYVHRLLPIGSAPQCSSRVSKSTTNELVTKIESRIGPWLRAWLVSRDFCNFELTWVSFGIVFYVYWLLLIGYAPQRLSRVYESTTN